MRVLITVSPWPTHYAGLIPVGWALQAEGHEVRVACGPSQTPTLLGAGLTPAPVLGDQDLTFQGRLWLYMTAREGLWPYPEAPLNPLTGEPLASLEDVDYDELWPTARRKIGKDLEDGYEGVAELVEAWRPDIVLNDFQSVEGMLAARLAGVESLMWLWGPIAHGDEHRDMRTMPKDFTDGFSRRGVEPLTSESIRHVIDPNPASLAPDVATAERHPIRYIPYNGQAMMATWACEPPTRPRILVVWGTSLRSLWGPGALILPTLLEGLSGLGAEIICTARPDDVATMGALPDDVRVLTDFPIGQLLPTCDMVVHSGGAGCLLTAVDTATPQLVIGSGLDATMNATRLAATGAGVDLPRWEADPRRVREAADQLLGRATAREAAERLRDELHARPTPAAFVRSLEDMAGRVALA